MMTSPNPMTTEELLELAALDAFGLLDQYEAAIYTRCFHNAPASAQDEILRLQAEVVADETLLPADEPDDSLRERVLKAVAKAIEEDSHKLAPIASIGRRLSVAGDDTATGRSNLPNQIWRAVALVMIGVTIVFAYFKIEAEQRAIMIADLALQNNTMSHLESLIGPTFREYVGNPSVDTLVFKNRATDTDILASIHINKSTNSAFLLLMGLPATEDGEVFTLRAVTADKEPQIVKQFNDGKTHTGFRLDNLSASLLATTTWEITDAAGRVILSTA